MTTAPQSIASHVLDFCASINPAAKPVYVPVLAAGLAIPGKAFHNVRSYIASTRRGRARNGWLIWEWPGLFIEAEHHCVHGSVTGPSFDLFGDVFRDVTPCGEPRILFLPDETATYDFKADSWARPTIRKAIRDHRLVHEYLAVYQMRDDFMRAKLKPGARLERSLSTREMTHFAALLEELERLEFELMGLDFGFVSQPQRLAA